MGGAKVLELAAQAGICRIQDHGDDRVECLTAELISFARLVAAAEREACAKSCEQVNEATGECPELAQYCADAIRSRTE